jgi:hypothetical protein
MSEITDNPAMLPAEPPPGFKSEFDWRVCELLACEYERVGRLALAQCIRLGMSDPESRDALSAFTRAVADGLIFFREDHEAGGKVHP